MQKKYVVLGSLFGDEGKGQVTQALVKKAKNEKKSVCVVRFSGGAQAAHNIRIKNDNGHVLHHTCSTYGSGVLLDVPTYLFSQVYFDPMAAWCERQALIELTGRYPALLVHRDCRIVTPYDQYAQHQDEKVLSDGTCGKGIYQTFKRYNDGVPTKCMSKVKEYYENLSGIKFPNHINCIANQVDRDFHFGSWFMYFEDEKQVLSDYDVIIFEGAQGLLLDMDNGFWPHVTPSHTGLDNIKDYLNEAEVYLVSRTYLTRHGNGYTPKYPETMSKFIDNFVEDNCKNEFQGEFRKGMLDIGLLSQAWDRHHLETWKAKYNLYYNMVFTHSELFGRYTEIPVIGMDGSQQYPKNTSDLFKLLPENMRSKIGHVYTLSGNSDTELFHYITNVKNSKY